MSSISPKSSRSSAAKYFFKNFEEILCSVFLITMIALVIVNVFLRYLFNYSIFWAEEVATICFVWLVFVGASATYKHKMDMGIDVLITKTPATHRKIHSFCRKPYFTSSKWLHFLYGHCLHQDRLD